MPLRTREFEAIRCPRGCEVPLELAQRDPMDPTWLVGWCPGCAGPRGLALVVDDGKGGWEVMPLVVRPAALGIEGCA